jgi:ATP-binding cassette subfamily B (MDR/TAP) protein 1
LVGVFNGFEAGTVSGDELRSKISTFSLYYVYLSIGLFVFTYVATVGYYYSGERIARALRLAYLGAILRQNIAFFDLLGPGEVTNRIMTDMGTVQEAVTSKLAVLLSAMATFCAAFVVAFIMYWKTALILSPFFVAMLASASIGGAYAVRYHKGAMQLYSQATSIAEEAIGAIRHVTAFGIQHILSQRYMSVLKQAAVEDGKAENTVAVMIAWMNAMPCLLYALSFWAGSKYLVKDEVSVEGVTATTLAVTIGSFAIIRIAPSIQALTSGVAIAGAVLKSIARQSPQDPLAYHGEKPGQVEGTIRFENVNLVYPSRDDVKVLNNLTLTCAAMKKTAFVGPSGGGKSSILGLIERFYEPTGGLICESPLTLIILTILTRT